MTKGKQYKRWTKMKSIIEKYHKGFVANPGDIVWVYIGTNIGKEICGHDGDWKRPVLILKRIHTLYIVIPMTTHGLYEDDRGRWLIKPYHHKITSADFGKPSYLILHQLRTIDQKRFFRKAKDIHKKYAKLNITEFINIRKKLIQILSSKIKSPHRMRGDRNG